MVSPPPPNTTQTTQWQVNVKGDAPHSAYEVTSAVRWSHSDDVRGCGWWCDVLRNIGVQQHILLLLWLQHRANFHLELSLR